MGEVKYRILNHNVYRELSRHEIKFIQLTEQELIQEDNNNWMVCVGRTNSDENALEYKSLLEEEAVRVRNRLLSGGNNEIYNYERT